jgi:hypothetical protein
MSTIVIDEFTESFFAGYKREVATKKQNGELKCTEGKMPLTFESIVVASKQVADLIPEMEQQTRRE